MTQKVREKIALAGGGLVGSLLATYLGRTGHSVAIYETRPDPRQADTYEGRSFNLVLSQRGLLALRKVGIEDEILRLTTRMPGRIIHTAEGQEHYQPYGAGERDCLYAISRASLNRALLSIAERSGDVTIHFSHRCLDYDVEARKLKIRQKDGSDLEVKTERVFGTDGSSSAIRDRLTQLTGAEHVREIAEYGYKELFIPATAEGRHAMEPHAFHVWPRGKYVMTAQTNIDGSFSGALFLPTEGDVSFSSITSESIREFFEHNFPDLVPLMPDLVDDYQRNPVGSLCTVRCPNWYYQDKIVLLGDAAHAVVPFYGQGLNCGFEDVMALDGLIQQHAPDWQTVFRSLEERRKPNAYAIADLSLRNMREMSDGITDPNVLLAKEIAHRLAVQYPSEIITTHAMVTAHPEISYVDAMARGSALDRVTLDIARGVTSVDQVDLAMACRNVLLAYASLNTGA